MSGKSKMFDRLDVCSKMSCSAFFILRWKIVRMNAILLGWDRALDLLLVQGLSPKGAKILTTSRC